MPTPYKILILGASYGSLLATKLALAGHSAQLVCLPAEAELDQQRRLRRAHAGKGREGLVEIDSHEPAGQDVRRRYRGAVNPADYDLVALAMQEPQYRSPGVRELLDAVAKRESAVHVDHEHAAAALPEAHPRPRTPTSSATLHRPDGVGRASTRR